MQRNETIQRIKANPHISVLIIGGGINGLGTFRDLALQGVDVLVVDRADFCSGASAASSHMVHGGIRYLENGEFRLVREAVKERNRLLKNAPQYVKPLATNMPIFRWFSGILNAPLKFLDLLNKPGERGAIVIKLGMMMYDAYTGGDGTVPRHKVVGAKTALKEYPLVNPDIVAMGTYYDAAMPSPERIAIEVMLEGEAAGGMALNYVSAVGADRDSVRLKDELTGETFSVQPKLVINAAGPWIDFANDALGKETKFIGGTKGSHIVLNHPELHHALKGHEFFFENYDGRIVLIYPLLDKVLVGTSDIPITDPDEAVCTEEEVDYFFELVQKMFPKITLDRTQIVYRFSGVRPLPASDANSPGQISRDHSNRIVEANGRSFPIFNLVGGKWTTFRAFAESVTDEALARLGVSRKLSTAERPLAGGKDYPRTAEGVDRFIFSTADETGVEPDRIRILFDRYGTKAAEIARYLAAGDDAPLQHNTKYTRREIAYLTQHEKVTRLDDLILRRTLIGMLGELTRPLLEELVGVVAETLGWSESAQQEALERVVIMMEQHHQVAL